MEKIAGKLADASSYVLSLEYAIPLNILVSSVMGRTLYPACLNIGSWFSDKTMGQLLKIKFKKERHGEDYFLVREW